MEKLCIVPCGSRKIWSKEPAAGPVKAQSVYIGPFAKKCQDYAKHFYPDSWCILSAKYGFLFPDDIVPGDYNVTFNKKRTNPISLLDLKRQVEVKQITKIEQVVILGGKEYIRMAREIFVGAHIITPLEGVGGIGKMMQKIGELIQADIPV